jgi:hypothetical protein
MFGDVKAVPYSTSMLSVELIHIKHQTKRIWQFHCNVKGGSLNIYPQLEIFFAFSNDLKLLINKLWAPLVILSVLSVMSTRFFFVVPPIAYDEFDCDSWCNLLREIVRHNQ